MKKKAFWKIALAVVAAISFTACTNDESYPLEGIEGALPEGMYPLQIASVTMEAESSAQPWGAKEAQTRVSENTDGNSSKWDGNETIYVLFSNQTTTYNVTSDGTPILTDDATQLYWQNKNDAPVIAWYVSSESNGTVSLSDQSKKLAYVLRADEIAEFNVPVTLSFTHQLAKVRVALQGNQADNVADVKIRSLTSCTHTQGTVSGNGAEGWITMKPVTYNNVKYYEANVVPGRTIMEFQVNGKEGTLDNGITPLAAKVNTITLTVNKAATEITGGATVTTPGDYIVTGSVTETITLNGEGINLTLKDADIAITGQNKPAIDITGGSTTLIVEGTNNTLSSAQWGGITMSGGANLTIKGKGKDLSSLKVTANGNANEQVSTVGIGASSNATCGYIKIQNVTLKVLGGNSWNNYTGSAAIGTSTVNSKCGPIEITKSDVTATGGNGAAAIGLGYTAGQVGNIDVWHNKVESITIKKSAVIATVKSTNWSECGACIGLCAAVGTAKLECGTITIENAATDFLDKLTRTGSPSSVQSWKIGKGMIMDTDTGTVLFSGGTFNGTAFTDGYGSW